MKTRYYYHRDYENKPIITVCLLKNGKEISRGISICSNDDVPCKKTGRKIALTRAMWALDNKDTTCDIAEPTDIMYLCSRYIDTKATYMPELTKHEDKLLADYKKEKKNV